MSSNVVSQFLVSDRKQVQAEHPSGSLNFPVSEPEMKMTIDPLHVSGSHNFSVSKDEPMLNNSGFKTSMIMSNKVGRNDVSTSSLVSIPIWMSSQLHHDDSVLQNNLAQGKTLFPVKRKAEAGTSFKDSISKETLLPSKRPSYTVADVGSVDFIQPSAPQRRTATTHNKLSSSSFLAQSLMNKKLVGNNSLLDKHSFESVRSKMKESLEAALALVKQQISNSQGQTNARTGHSVPVASDSAMGISGSRSEVSFSKELAVSGGINNCRVSSAELPLNECSGNNARTFHEFQYSSMLPDEDITFSDSFFVKDDLLQGNGLSWAFDFDVQMREGTEAQNSEKLKPGEQEAQILKDRGNLNIFSPENVASEIEAELFKLFGGVNKKYKEKGRSLLFNLKDRSNPELRERVLSGEISPTRLCSMSAEDLASKELSQWRMAKAEELAQMVVLPDTEVDIRRLVRKTHKGEFQVEVEHDDGTFAEVSSGTSMLIQRQPKKEVRTHPPSVINPNEKEDVAGQQDSSENQDFSGSLIIQTDGTDLMQGMMVDELKDAEFLPPIVSLDEFMESLNSEPPFESLSADAEQKTPRLHKESPRAVDFQVLDQNSISAKDASRKVDVVKKAEPISTTKLIASPAKKKVLPSTTLGIEYMWQGMLQLNASASITVSCIFRSGEKTSIKEWPISFEIMGRVRLDSFEKFFRDLPMSRTRAVMVIEFDLKDKSSETERLHLFEAVDSYALDERLGYAEPTTGVELYLCPPTSRMTDLLNVLMPKESSDTRNTTDNKLIGVVVWRRAHISNARSPNSSSHNNHGLKKQSFTTPKRVQDLSNANANTPTSPTPPVTNNAARIIPDPEPEDCDDIPPGFGPMTPFRSVKDEDDLPEFKFSGHSTPFIPKKTPQNLSTHGLMSIHRPVDQIRELIHKYGQSGSSATDNGLGEKKSNYDDDDIPEWQPEAPNQFPQRYHSTVLSPMMSHQQPLSPMMSHQPPLGLGPRPRLGGRWTSPPEPRQDQRWK